MIIGRIMAHGSLFLFSIFDWVSFQPMGDDVTYVLYTSCVTSREIGPWWNNPMHSIQYVYTYTYISNRATLLWREEYFSMSSYFRHDSCDYYCDFYGLYGPANAQLPWFFRPWTFSLNIGLNMLPSDSCMSCLHTLLGYPSGEFQVL